MANKERKSKRSRPGNGKQSREGKTTARPVSAKKSRDGRRTASTDSAKKSREGKSTASTVSAKKSREGKSTASTVSAKKSREGKSTDSTVSAKKTKSSEKKIAGPLGGEKYIEREQKHAEEKPKKKTEYKPGMEFEESTPIKPKYKFGPPPHVESEPTSQPCPVDCINKNKKKTKLGKSASDTTDRSTSPRKKGCVYSCRQKVKIGDGPTPKKGKKRKKGKGAKHIEVCAPSCAPDVDMDDLKKLISEFTGIPDYKAGKAEVKCASICCPPGVRSQNEIYDEFLADFFSEVELANVSLDDESCLCEEVNRWMRYFMCSCTLNRGDKMELADAVVLADNNIPGLLDALIKELESHADRADKPERKKKTPEMEEQLYHIGIRALHAVQRLEEARNRRRAAVALKVAADMVAAEYNERMKAKLAIMLEMVEKKSKENYQRSLRPNLVEMTSSEMIVKNVDIPEY